MIHCQQNSSSIANSIVIGTFQFHPLRDIQARQHIYANSELNSKLKSWLGEVCRWDNNYNIDDHVHHILVKQLSIATWLVDSVQLLHHKLRRINCDWKLNGNFHHIMILKWSLSNAIMVNEVIISSHHHSSYSNDSSFIGFNIQSANNEPAIILIAWLHLCWLVLTWHHISLAQLFIFGGDPSIISSRKS